MQRMCDGFATFGPGRMRRALVVLMCGLPAAGKTTTAERLHAGLGGVLIRSCDVYQELGISLPDWVQRTRGFTHDVTAYEQARDAAYVRMLSLLECNLTVGAKIVIIDAVHGEPAKRRAVFRVCAAFGADPLLVWCRCDDRKETERRIMRRPRSRSGLRGERSLRLRSHRPTLGAAFPRAMRIGRGADLHIRHAARSAPLAISSRAGRSGPHRSGADGAAPRSAHAPLEARRSSIEGIGAAQSLGEELHQLQGEVRILTHEEIELRLVDLDELRLLEGDRAGRSRRLLEERHLAEHFVLGQRVNGDAADHDGHAPPLDGEHALALLTLLEDGRARGVHHGLHRVPKQAELPRLRGHLGAPEACVVDRAAVMERHSWPCPWRPSRSPMAPLARDRALRCWTPRRCSESTRPGAC